VRIAKQKQERRWFVYCCKTTFTIIGIDTVLLYTKLLSSVQT